ncbi:MAG TPA: hypothetical protein VN934_00780 [Candidatus Tumulicola sp.]|jgi:hypothetical protein|nr:hypothetical protein [Candidatus Tumulicola sp.]
MFLTLAAVAAATVISSHDTSYFPHDYQTEIVARVDALTGDAGA